MKENIIQEKCLQFAVRIVKLAEFLENKKQKVIANQILRSGTSIGANVSESTYAASKIDFINKLKIAEKEASETAYWLELLRKTEYITESQYENLNGNIVEIKKLLGASVRTARGK